MPTLAMAILAFVIMIGLRRYNPKLPGVLIAVVITSIISWQINFEQRQLLSLEQISSPEVYRLIEDQLRLHEEIEESASEINDLEDNYSFAREQLGDDDAQTLQALHTKDIAFSSLQQKQQQYRDDLKELRNLHFKLVVSDEKNDTVKEKLYLRGSVPAGKETIGDIWRLRVIQQDQRLLITSGGAVVGHVPQGLPEFQIPKMNWDIISQLLSAALTIALIGFMEAIAIAKNMATKTRQRLNANQELIGQGLSNLLGSLFQSYAVAGSFSRSAVNISAGAITGFSSVVTGLVVVIALLWLTPLLYHLPQATLAAVIMVAVMGLVNIAPMKHVWKAHRHDGIVAIITFVLTLVMAPHLDSGIIIGVGLSLGLYLYRTMKPRVAVLSRYGDGSLRDVHVNNLKTCENISVIRFDGSLYFANTGYFEDQILLKVANYPNLKFVIIDAEGINQIDATGEDMLLGLMQRLRESGIELLFAVMKRQILDTLRRTGDIKRLGEAHFFARVDNALDFAWQALGDEHNKEHCPLHVMKPLTEEEKKEEEIDE
ncbi:MAG: STAS domain-containing protein [Proteobacteria bacterium]|nr:STAS domain-containing protein [Pseudomonadota bacterium]